MMGTFPRVLLRDFMNRQKPLTEKKDELEKCKEEKNNEKCPQLSITSPSPGS